MPATFNDGHRRAIAIDRPAPPTKSGRVSESRLKKLDACIGSLSNTG
jgi:hypothetical protein